MSNFMILGPAAESAKTSQEQAQGDDHSTDAAADSNGNQQHQRAEKDGIISEEDCVRGIAHVARLVALGVLTPSKANTIRRCLARHLAVSQKQVEASRKRRRERRCPRYPEKRPPVAQSAGALVEPVPDRHDHENANGGYVILRQSCGRWPIGKLGSLIQEVMEDIDGSIQLV